MLGDLFPLLELGSSAGQLGVLIYIYMRTKHIDEAASSAEETAERVEERMDTRLGELRMDVRNRVGDVRADVRELREEV